MGIASYTETPRLEVMYSEEAKHMTSTATARNRIRRAREGDGMHRLIARQVKSTIYPVRNMLTRVAAPMHVLAMTRSRSSMMPLSIM